MEPCSILELTTVVLKVVSQIYKLLKTAKNAPRDVRDYLVALENTRKVLVHVEDYILFRERTLFKAVDKLQLEAIQVVLHKCKLTFALQLSIVEGYDAHDAASTWRQLRKRICFGFGQDVLIKCTAKLQTFQALLNQALTASIGKDTVVIRSEIGLVRSEMIDMTRKQQQQYKQMFLAMEQYTKRIQKGVPELITQSWTADSEGYTDGVDLKRGMVDGHPMSDHDNPDSPQDIPPHTGITIIHASNRWGGVSRSFNDELLIVNTRNESLRCLPVLVQSAYEDRKQPMSKREDMNRTLLDMIAARGPQSNILVSGTITIDTIDLIIPTSQTSDEMSLATAELCNVIYGCGRELQMYQDQGMTDLVEKIIKPLEISSLILHYDIRNPLSEHDRETLKDEMTELRHIYKQIRLEVDYRHRAETRETALRVQDIQVQQLLLTGILNDQRGVLESMMRKTQWIDSIQGRQDILQNMLQAGKVADQGNDSGI
ncbi:hypothetical protein F5Y18DRAFT_425733 [Xylariaceae sp. FL1019]|nr:hypothetical protein F5Y18DRAFT_425733 [Xylariaceae sp. FL1019]